MEYSNKLQKVCAVAHYQAGLALLAAGLEVFLPPPAGDQSLVRAHRLRSKMQGNLETGRERLAFLTTSLALENLSVAAPVPQQQQARAGIQRSASREEPGKSVSSPTRPRVNRAAELRKKKISSSNSKAEGEGGGGLQAGAGKPGPGPSKMSEKEGLRR